MEANKIGIGSWHQTTGPYLTQAAETTDHSLNLDSTYTEHLMLYATCTAGNTGVQCSDVQHYYLDPSSDFSVILNKYYMPALRAFKILSYETQDRSSYMLELYGDDWIMWPCEVGETLRVSQSASGSGAYDYVLPAVDQLAQVQTDLFGKYIDCQDEGWGRVNAKSDIYVVENLKLIMHTKEMIWHDGEFGYDVEAENGKVRNISSNGSVGVIGEELTIDTMDVEFDVDYVPPSIVDGEATYRSLAQGLSDIYYDEVSAGDEGIEFSGGHNVTVDSSTEAEGYSFLVGKHLSEQVSGKNMRITGVTRAKSVTAWKFTSSQDGHVEYAHTGDTAQFYKSGGYQSWQLPDDYDKIDEIYAEMDRRGAQIIYINNRAVVCWYHREITKQETVEGQPLVMHGVKLVYVPQSGASPEAVIATPRGTPIRWFRGTPYELKALFYTDVIKRLGPKRFRASCMSAIGLLEGHNSPGDVYNGSTFKNVLDKILTLIPGLDYAVQSMPGDAYRFTLQSDGYYERTNGGINNSYAYCKLVFNDHGTNPLVLQCIDQAENSYDFGILSKVDTELGHNYSEDSSSLVYHSFKGESSATPKTITYPLMGEGEHYITIKYRKDSSQHTSPDTFKFKVTSSEGTKICDYEVSSAVSGIPVSGWLPYDTARNNLHRLLFAYNVALLRAPDDPGKLLFTFLGNDTPATPGTLYLEGDAEYPAMPKQVKITEHTYGKPKSYAEDELLYDNSGDGVPAAALDVIFDSPVDANTLRKEGNLTFTGHTNYATVSGNGKLYGKLYEHSTREFVKDTGNSSGNTVSVPDNGLISLLNSRNVADKLIDYYGNAVKMKASVIMENEKCGNRYTFTDIFGDTVTGLLTKMRLTVSAIVKAACDFVSGLTFPGKGIVYNSVIKYDTVGSGSITVPAGVTRIRAVLIGGGTGGDSGYAGEPGQSATEGAQLGGEGGKGGAGGKGGEGGRVYSVEIDVTPGQVISCNVGQGGAGGLGASATHDTNVRGQEGSPTTITVGGVTYSSASGARSDRGFYDPINKQYHAENASFYETENGTAGGDGGPGGEQGLDRIIQASAKGRDGKAVKNAGTGVTYAGGTGGLGGITGRLVYLAKMNSGLACGGGGAAGAVATGAGNNGSAASATQREVNYNTLITLKPGNGGNGSKPNARSYLVDHQLFGYGGSGGHGGSGGGGAGAYTEFSDTYSSHSTYVEAITPGTPGTGGQGGDGSQGQKGGILIYYEA